MIGGDALIPRGDSMLIGANPGETVLTKEFTDQLKPTVATLNEFNARMAKPITTILPSSSNDTSVNSECNITINVDKINNEQDIKKLAYQLVILLLNVINVTGKKFANLKELSLRQLF